MREPTLSIRLLWPFVRALGEDVRVLDVLAEMGQSALDLTERDRRISCRVALHGLARATELFGDASLGLRAGLDVDHEPADVVAGAACTVDTLHDALQLYVRFGALSNEGASLWLDVQGARASFCHAPSFVQPSAANDFMVASTLGFARRHCDTYAPPLEVWLMHERPRDVVHEVAYERSFECAVRFDAPYNAVVFPRSALHTKMRGRNALLAAAFERRCSELARAQSASRSITQHVREVLAPRLAGGSLDMLDVAHALGVSPTTLWRRLEEERTSFSAILDELRREAALRYLRKGTLSLTEISGLLGFADVRAFTKAFKRWLGVSPAKYREARQASSA